MLEKAGKNSGDNRRDNRGLVLRMVATGACRTRRDLVVRTGLSKMTISNIVGEMIDGDVLRESEVVCSEEPGRNPVRLRLSPEAPKAAGVAFLPGRCESVLCGLDLRVFRRAGTDLPKDAPEAVRRETALRLLDKMLSGMAGVRAIGLAADLPWRPGGEQMCPSESVRPAVRERYGLPVFLEDTCQSALLVESLFGRARNCRDVLFVSLGDRVGSAVLSGGQLCRGRGRTAPGAGPCHHLRRWPSLPVRRPWLPGAVRSFAGGAEKTVSSNGTGGFLRRFLPDNRQRGSRPGVPGDRGLSGCGDRQRPESAEQRTGVAGRRRTLLDRPARGGSGIRHRPPAPSGWGRQSPGEKAALPGGGSASGGGLRRDRPDLLGGATSSKRVISRGGLPQYRKSHKKYIFLL